MSSVQDIKVEELLPFYVNNSLTSEECDAVEEALAKDEQLRNEIAALTSIKDEMKAELEAEEDMYSPGAFGFARLNREIENETREIAPKRTNVIQFGLIAAAAALFGAFVTTYATPNSGSDTAIYDTASAGTQMPRLRVEFDGSATMSELSEALNSSGVEISAGPTALGFYEVSLFYENDIAIALDSLKAQGEVIKSVEIIE